MQDISVAHYHIDLYTVDKQTQMNITCPGGSSDSHMMMPGMEGMDMSGSDSGSSSDSGKMMMGTATPSAGATK